MKEKGTDKLVICQQQDHRAGDLHFSKWMGSITPLEDHLEIVQLSAARARATEEAGAAIARAAERAADSAVALHERDQAAQPSVLPSAWQSCLSAAGGGERASANRTRLRDGEADVGQSSGRRRSRSANRARRARPAAAGTLTASRGVMFASGVRPEAADQARARGAQPDQRRVLQQAGRLADEHQPKDLREPSRRGHAQARRPQYRGSRPQGAAAARLISAECRDGICALNARDLSVADLSDCGLSGRNNATVHSAASAEIFRERANARRGPREHARPWALPE